MDENPFFNRLADTLRRHDPAVLADLAVLRQLDCDELRKRYLVMVSEKIRRRWDARLVDKNPLNMLWLPLIYRLYPAAKHVLAIRHPCDVILSCYMQNFRSSILIASSETLERLARASGVSRAMLGQIELGQSTPTINVLWKIARALGVPFSALITSRSAGRTTVMSAARAKVLTSHDGAFSSRALFPFEAAPPAGPLGADQVQAVVGGDLDQPGQRRRLGAEAGVVHERFGEYVLHGVLGFGAISQQENTAPVHAASVLLIELFERRTFIVRAFVAGDDAEMGTRG
jgi:transcriptional regulator with XRE-family HTH domain